MKSQDLINKVKTLLSMEVKLEQAKLDNGTTVEAEVFEVGAEIFILMDGERVALPAGEYVMETGEALTVTEEGVIGSIGTAEEAPAEVEEQEMSEKPAAAATQTPKKMVESISKELHFSKEFEKFQTKIEEMQTQFNTELAAIKKELETKKETELSAEVKPIKHNPELKADKKVNLNTTGRTPKTRIYEFLNNRK